jgi:hypothetical protein
VLPVPDEGGRYVAFQTFGRFGPADRDRAEDIYCTTAGPGRPCRLRSMAPSMTYPGHTWSAGYPTTAGTSPSPTQTTPGYETACGAPLGCCGTKATTRPGQWNRRSARDPRDGPYVAFSSRDPRLGDRPGQRLSDVVRLELSIGQFQLVSQAANGPAGNGESFAATLAPTPDSNAAHGRILNCRGPRRSRTAILRRVGRGGYIRSGSHRLPDADRPADRRQSS